MRLSPIKKNVEWSLPFINDRRSAINTSSVAVDIFVTKTALQLLIRVP